MTLKEKFDKVMVYPFSEYREQVKILKEENSNEYLKIADEFAIGFYNWMRVNDIQDNAEKYFHYTDKDMLNVYKEEKGL
jgi:hypothetical protein